jgi:glycosyltransferase involved in cell wall biosynthesis
MARVSVLISTYRRHELLRRALQSVLAQTCVDFDVLVWNDGGLEMEGSVPELEDPRVRYHHHPENLGVLQAVGLGLKAVEGEYVAHLDDDDEWSPEFLANQARLLDENPSAAIAFCDHWVMNEDGSINNESTEANSRHWRRTGLRAGLHEPAYELTFNGTIPLASAAMLRRSALALDDIPPELHHAYDIWISYLATRSGAGVVYEPRRLVRERRHAQQIGSPVASTPMLGDLALFYERVWHEPSFAVDRDVLAERLAETKANWAIALLRDGDYKRAREAARRSTEVKRSLRGGAAVGAAALPPRASRLLARSASDGLGRWRRLTQGGIVGQGSYSGTG